MDLTLNIVTFVPKGTIVPRICKNPQLVENIKLCKHPIRINVFLNSAASASKQIRDYFKGLNVSVFSTGTEYPLGYARNFLFEKALIQGATHIINLDDDDYIINYDNIINVINKFPDKPIYIQRLRNGSIYPAVDNDSGNYILHGKFISNGYACMVMPTSWLVKYKLNFPEFIDTYEDNYFFTKLIMNYDGDFVFMANPYYIQSYHDPKEFSMSTKSIDKLNNEEYQLINQVTKFDSYIPKISHIVASYDNNVYELNKNDLIKFYKLYSHDYLSIVDPILFIGGRFHYSRELVDKLKKINGVYTIGNLQVSRIIEMREFLKYNSYYTTYRLFSKYDPAFIEIRKAIKDRYYDKSCELSEKILSKQIIMLTSWNLL